MPRRLIETNKLMQPIAHFSHAARIGDLVHIGATAGTDADRRLAGTTPGRVEFAAQAQQMFDNLETVLDLASARIEDVVRVKSYITDARDIAAYRAIYGERLGTLAPNHVIVGSHAFPLPQAALEIDVIAMAGVTAQHFPASDAARHPSVLVGDTFYATALPDSPTGDATAQSRQALVALANSLNAAGLTFSDVVNIHVTLADARSFAALEAVYSTAFAAPYPTRCIVAAPLENAAHCLQIEATAVRGGGDPVGTADGALRSASPAMLAGDTLYVSGQDGSMHGANCEAQTRGAWVKINALIEAAGFPPDSVLRTNNVLTDWRNYAGFNAGYGANVRSPYPPRATVLGSLLDHRALVQVEAIAHRKGSDASIVQVPGVP